MKYQVCQIHGYAEVVCVDHVLLRYRCAKCEPFREVAKGYYERRSLRLLDDSSVVDLKGNTVCYYIGYRIDSIVEREL